MGDEKRHRRLSVRPEDTLYKTGMGTRRFALNQSQGFPGADTRMRPLTWRTSCHAAVLLFSLPFNSLARRVGNAHTFVPTPTFHGRGRAGSEMTGCVLRSAREGLSSID
jgi:hypothetical protein